MRIDIRQATKEDIPRMAQVINATYKEAFSGLLSDETIAKYTNEKRRLKSLEELFTEKLPHYVVIYDGVLCGVLTAVIPKRELPFTVEILQLYVLSEYRGKRLGKKLLSHALCGYRKLGYKTAVLTTLEENENAIAFYKHFGFSSVGLIATGLEAGKRLEKFRIEL